MILTWGPFTIVSRKVFLTLHFLNVFWGYITFNPTLMILALCVNIAIALTMRDRFLVRRVDAPRLIVLAICGALVTMLPFAMHRSDFAVLHAATGFFSVLAAFAIARHPEDATTALRNTLIIGQAVTLVFLGMTNETSLPLDHMIEGASSNGVTSFIIVLQASYLLMLLHVRGRSAILTAAVTLWICLLGYGRGSIIAAALLFFTSVAVYGFLIRPLIARFAFLAFQIFAAAFLFYSFLDAVYSYLSVHTKLGAGLVDDHRRLILGEYLAAMDGVRFLIGSSFSGMAVESVYNGNPHSSYIRMHHLFGLPYMLAVLFVLGVGAVASRGKVRRLFDFSVLVALTFRAASEPILFPTPLDIFFFVGIFGILLGRQGAGDQRYNGRMNAVSIR